MRLNKAGLTIRRLARDDGPRRKAIRAITTLGAEVVVIIAIPPRVDLKTGLQQGRVIIIIADGVVRNLPLARIDFALLDVANAPIGEGGFFKRIGRNVVMQEIIRSEMSLALKGCFQLPARQGSLLFYIGIRIIYAKGQAVQRPKQGENYQHKSSHNVSLAWIRRFAMLGFRHV